MLGRIGWFLSWMVIGMSVTLLLLTLVPVVLTVVASH